MQAPLLPVVAGTPFDIGAALGRLARAAVDDLTASASWRELQGMSGDPHLQEWVACARAAFPDGWEELQGMAGVMGVDPHVLFIWNCRNDLHRHGNIDSCTIAVNRLESRYVLHVQQHGGAAHEQPRLVEIRPLAKTPFICMYTPGCLPGYGAAASRSGLLQVVTQLGTGMPGVGVPTSFIARAALGGDSLADALDLVVQSRRIGTARHILASSHEFIMAMVDAGANDTVLNPIPNKLLCRTEAGNASTPGFDLLRTLYNKLPHHPGRDDMLELWHEYTVVQKDAQAQSAFFAMKDGCVDLHLHSSAGTRSLHHINADG